MNTSAAPIEEIGQVTVDARPQAALWEQAVLALWILTTFVIFEGDELLLYPLALFFLGSIVLRRRQVVPVMFRAWVLFTLPIMATLSAWWSPVFNEALRFGLMMFLTAAIAVYVAVRFRPKQIIQSLFAAGAVTIFMVAPEAAAFEYGGPYGEKNIFAIRMLVVLLAALAITLNPDEGPVLRLIALPFIPVSFAFIIIADAVTSFVFGSVSILIMLMVWMFWSGLGRVQHMRTLLLCLLALIFLTVVTVIVSLPNTTLFEDFVGAFGKDTTLTGRTMLWEEAERIVQDNPLFGVGAEGFWLFSRGDAQTLLELSYKDYGIKFSFHSAYYETQVHLGLVGLVLLYMIIGWCLIRSVLGWLRDQSITRSFFFLSTAIFFVSTFTESWFFSVFDVGVMLFYISAVSTFSRKEKMTLVMAPAEWVAEMRGRSRGAQTA